VFLPVHSELSDLVVLMMMAMTLVLFLVMAMV
jgi:hypothetical protein